MSDDSTKALKEVEKLLKKIKNKHLHQNIESPIVKSLIQMMTARMMGILSQDVKLEKEQYLCPEHWVLTHGIYFKGQDLPKGYVKGIPKQCFFNTFRGCTDSKITAKSRKSKEELIYVEGYTLYIFPILHAWNINHSQEIIDLTLPAIPGLPFAEREYFGVPFNFSYVSKTAHDRSSFDSLIDDWRKGWPLMLNNELLKKAKLELK